MLGRQLLHYRVWICGGEARNGGGRRGTVRMASEGDGIAGLRDARNAVSKGDGGGVVNGKERAAAKTNGEWSDIVGAGAVDADRVTPV